MNAEAAQKDGGAAERSALAANIERTVLAPVRAFRLRYLPLLMIYFAYGASGIISVPQSFWVKSALALSPAELAGIAVWLAVPWGMKMVFGQFVDSIPVLGSQRRAYVFLGAGLVAGGLLLLSFGAAGAVTLISLEAVYVLASLLIVVGLVLQDVVADAMSTEVVPRSDAAGNPRPKAEVDHELGMVQVLGRLAFAFGMLSVAGLSGWLASVFSYSTVFLIGLAVPLISVSGALLVRLETTERKPVDWQILGGGMLFGVAIAALGLSQVAYSQEVVFVFSMAVISFMLYRVTEELDRGTRLRLFYAIIVIFAFRATPTVGEGYTWFTIDVLGFDEAFFGTLAQIGAAIAVVATWLFADTITRRPIATVLLWLTLLGGLLSLPTIALAFRVDLWTEQTFGFGARSIAIIDAAAASPLAQLSMIPLLTLTAIYAPPGRRATWFALMASLMNLALVAGQLQTKYLNEFFVVSRGEYGQLPALVLVAVTIGVAVPLAAILAFGRKIR